VLSGEWEEGLWAGIYKDGMPSVTEGRNMTLRKSRFSHYKCQDFKLEIIAHYSKRIEKV
jgi:hypothetical protein